MFLAGRIETAKVTKNEVQVSLPSDSPTQLLLPQQNTFSLETLLYFDEIVILFKPIVRAQVMGDLMRPAFAVVYR